MAIKLTKKKKKKKAGKSTCVVGNRLLGGKMSMQEFYFLVLNEEGDGKTERSDDVWKVGSQSLEEKEVEGRKKFCWDQSEEGIVKYPARTHRDRRDQGVTWMVWGLFFYKQKKKVYFASAPYPTLGVWFLSANSHDST